MNHIKNYQLPKGEWESMKKWMISALAIGAIAFSAIGGFTAQALDEEPEPCTIELTDI
ncbi:MULTISPECIES: hypothetical protein [Pontibacillus]|uniref:Cyclic lactone autoinducer peptide n=1 Tax=Pontibacillus chungwhensis TaxID=265426 RepID=A0ABY8V156_9BACI|nr:MULTISPECIES: hypothetical protein [Pontibacillus]WIF99681.1 hypothetical protein QNI29_08510 [Pontibacillus chungwhensis]